ncbi:MAG: hydantoinase B/oxoprolinase family protein [Myxococcota bacterium]|nr:hydantoinase B/oxoprolinase family protein [Myxococcota bacterium]
MTRFQNPLIAIDTGGTFTDVVASHPDHGHLRFKCPSTPDDPSRAILTAIAHLTDIWGTVDSASLLHDTTVATNAILEMDGARTVFVTNEGFEDLLQIGRQARPDLYALEPKQNPPLVQRAHTIGIAGRLDASGRIVDDLPSLEQWMDTHHALFKDAESIAICLLHSYLNDVHETCIAEALSDKYPEVKITLSSAIAPVPREFERATTTVVNAFVGPLMDRYLGHLQARWSALGGASSEVCVMGSAGTLLTLHDATTAPIHTVLSGPAGGVRGAWEAGRRLGRTQLLTVDMGGTSADVSIVTHHLRPDHAGRVGHHPIRVPILPIETVGAGGGSIAYIDAGGILRVGPHSAGAVPGPACYGRAGPNAQATVTDAHVVLGRLDELLGGRFTLDHAAALDAITRISDAMGTTPIETAGAILTVAEANMARACRRVTMERGIDPRSLTLVGFGGAAGLHACALADALGCADVIIPRASGMLSAEGIHAADHGEFYVRTVLMDDDAWSDAILEDLYTDAVDGLVSPPARATGHTVVLADCRYQGQTYTLPIECTTPMTASGLREAFQDQHARRYGYRLDPSRSIELVTLRVFGQQAPAERTKHVAPFNVVRTHTGPTRIDRYGATVWVPNGWEAAHTNTDDLLLTRAFTATPNRDSGTLALALEVHRLRLAAIAEEMGASLMKSAFSANIKERRDFSCAVFNERGHMLCHAAHIPVHLGSTALSVQATLGALKLTRGQHAIVNDPFSGGTHLPDVTIISPVFIGTASHPSYYVANRAHHADVGGRVPGSLVPLYKNAEGHWALTIDDEGIRIAPRILDDATRTAFANASRLPAERLGDLRAQEAANFVGAQRLTEWLTDTPLAVIQARNEALLDYSEGLMRRLIRSLPDGCFSFVDVLDSDGGSVHGCPIPVEVTIRGDSAVIDFTDAPDQVAGPLNAVRAIAVSAVFYCFRCLAGEAIPANEGLMRPLQIKTRPGSVIDAVAPAAVAAGNVETSQRIVDALFGALAQAAPDRVPAASCGSMNNILFGGLDMRAQPPRPYVHYETIGGGAGAGPSGPGAHGIQTHMTNTLNTPIEAIERLFPVCIEAYCLDEMPSGSDAFFPGGAGIRRRFKFLGPATVTLMTERRTSAPWGLHGAPDGRRGQNRLIRASGQTESLADKATIQVVAGDAIEIITPGGGGYPKRHG